MVRAKGPSKGADWLARERGLLGPRFTTSCVKLFEEKGDPWLTSGEQQEDYPLSRSREADKPLTPEQQRAADIYEKARAGLERRGVNVPKAFKPVVRPSLIVDPDMDRFTKAERREEKRPYVDPVGKPVIRDHARWRANLLQKTRLAMSAATVNVKDKLSKKGVVKGGFYVFSEAVSTKPKRKR